MIVYKCDRCKKDIAPGTQKYNIYKEYGRFKNIEIGEEIVHLCPECTEAFDKFLEGGDINVNFSTN